jgi:ABC-type glycerol-3-phosphate transport system substrate-binding protein
MKRALGLVTVLLSAITLGASARTAQTAEIVLWHSYNGSERAALFEAIRAFEETEHGFKVATNAVPYDVLVDKLDSQTRKFKEKVRDHHAKQAQKRQAAV